MYNSQFVEYCK